MLFFFDDVLFGINRLRTVWEEALTGLGDTESGEIAEINGDGDTGMICCEIKGTKGALSRRISVGSLEFAIAALVQANYGTRLGVSQLGAPTGRYLAKSPLFDGGESESMVAAIETNLPVLPLEPQRISNFATTGIDRGSSPGGNNSGDIFLVFSVAEPMAVKQLASQRRGSEFLNDENFDDINVAAVEADEEAVISAPVAAEDMTTLRPVGLFFRDLDC